MYPMSGEALGTILVNIIVQKLDHSLDYETK